MACSISCIISAVFLIGMIYFYNRTNKSKIVTKYKAQLPPDLQKRYEKTKNNKKTKELHEIAYNILSKNQESDSDSEGIIEEIVIKKAPKVVKPKLNRARSVKILPKEDEELKDEPRQETQILFY
jgi:predicted GIY-YIG superfamily endonuclease